MSLLFRYSEFGDFRHVSFSILHRDSLHSIFCVLFLSHLFICTLYTLILFNLSFVVTKSKIRCVDGPGEKILQTAEFYLRDYIGFGADIVMDLLTYWLSRT